MKNNNNLFLELLEKSTWKEMNNLYKWLQPLAISVKGNVINLDFFREDETSTYVKLYIYTINYSYSIVARIGKHEDYMGCQCSARKFLPGEDWFRGNDLPDGEFNLSTWNKILNGIVRNELEQISTYTTFEKYKSFEKFKEQLSGGIDICSASIL